MTEEFQMSSIVSMLPGALLDKEKTLSSLRQSKLFEWRKPILSFYEKLNLECGQVYQQHSEQKRKLEASIKQLNVERERINKEKNDKEIEGNILLNQITSRKQILASPKKQVPDEEELRELMEKVCTLREDIGKKKSELVNEWKRYKKGIFYYNKYLHCTVVVISNDTLLITLDTSAKSESDVREYLKFCTEDNGKSFRFLEMQPKLKAEHQLVMRYNETGDIQGFIVSFWKTMKTMNSRKVLRENN